MKIFGIGLSRTGTRSLADALKILGYNTVHYPWSLKEIHDSEASVDITVSCRFEWLDHEYPNSKFILTTRPFDEWIKSCKKHPRDKQEPNEWKFKTRLLMYGDTEWPPTDENEYLYKWSYEKHHESVNRFFKGRNDLLVLNLSDENKWELICEFLGRKVPDMPYPQIKEQKLF